MGAAELKLNEPGKKQGWSIVHATRRINLWDGSVRSGKTIASIIAWLDFIRHAPPGDLMMVGKTERTLRRNVLLVIQDLIGKRNIRVNSGLGEATIFGRRIFLVGAVNEIALQKIQGVTLAGAYGDEVATWPESFFNMLLSRLSVEGAQFFGTTNPDNPMHWLKVDYIDRAKLLDMNVFRFKLDDNPNLPKSYVDALKLEYTGLWYKRYIDGIWAAAEGAVYDMFDPDIHCVDELPKLSQDWVGIDYGTSNPTAFVPMSLGQDGVFYVHHTYRWDSKKEGRQKTDAEYSKDYRAWVKKPPHEPDCRPRVSREDEPCSVVSIRPDRIYSDPSAASFNLQLWRDGVRGVTAADNDVLDGIRDVASMLGAGILKFHRPTTRVLCDEMATLAWDPKAGEKGADKPIKKNDHGPDALRYVVRSTKYIWRRYLQTAVAKAAKEAA